MTLSDHLSQKLAQATAFLAEVADEAGLDLPDLVAGSSTPAGDTDAEVGNRIIHPAFEFRPDFIALSFAQRIIEPETKKVVEQRLRVVRSTAAARLVEAEPKQRTLRIGATDYVIDQRYDFPPFADDQWSIADIRDFLATRYAPKGAAVYDELVDAVHRHVDLPSRGAYVTLAVWPLISFTFPAFAAVPFLLFLGEKNTGKSQTLDVLSRLCRSGQKSRPTAASLGDEIEARRVIWLIDQANKLAFELLEILVDSYRAGASRTVVDVDSRGRSHRFETFGPKAFAAHRNFNEDLRDRCIQVPMLKATRRVRPLLANDDRLDRLRWNLYRYTVQNYRRLFQTSAFRDYDAVGDRLGFTDRELELWFPFEVLFEWLDVPEEDREAARQFYRQSIPNTKAELDDETLALLGALSALADGAGNRLDVRSDELTHELRAQGSQYLGPAKIGSRLSDLGLILAKDRRTRANGKRLTSWTINTERLDRQMHAWGIAGAQESDE